MSRNPRGVVCGLAHARPANFHPPQTLAADREDRLSFLLLKTRDAGDDEWGLGMIGMDIEDRFPWRRTLEKLEDLEQLEADIIE